MTSEPKAAILRAVDALEEGDRRGAAGLLREEMAANPSSDRLKSVARLATSIGECLMEIDALGRAASMPSATLETVLAYCESLARYSNTREAEGIINQLNDEARQHIAIQHFLGTLATQVGDFGTAEPHFRAVLKLAPLSAQTWYTLSTIKTFSLADVDIETMERLRPEIAAKMPAMLPQFLYALGKAYDDAGLVQMAMTAYDEGARLKRASEPYDRKAVADFADRLVRDFTPQAMAALKPSSCRSTRAIFVNGLPRSGTTLVEQILTSHSAVRDGAEINLMASAMIPVGNLTYPDALSFQAQASDPWGTVAEDYLCLVGQRFGPNGRIVDKTLSHARMMGLLLHSLPEARVVWLRRQPEDCALSCYRTFFATSLPWSWSVDDIASYFRSEDMLHAHWSALFPDRILTVPYESLVADPSTWIPRILDHVGLDFEPQVMTPEKQSRSVMTASVAQVREQISTARVGTSQVHGDFTVAFRRAYRGQ